MKEIIKYGIGVPLGLITVYPVLTDFILGLYQCRGSKTETKNELEKIVREEAPKLGLDPNKIDSHLEAHLHNSYWTSSVCRGKDDRWELWIMPDDATVALVKHELYHIYRDKGKRSFFKYYFISETRAKLYGVLGWRL